MHLIYPFDCKVSLADSIYMIAMLLGSYLYGYVSDTLGRRLACLLSLLNTAIGLLLTAFMPEYISFTISRFLSGLGKIHKNVDFPSFYIFGN